MLCCFRPPKRGPLQNTDVNAGQSSQQQLVSGDNVGHEPKGPVPAPQATSKNAGVTPGVQTGSSDYSQGPQQDAAKQTATASQRTPLVGSPSQEGVMRVVALLQELLSLTSERMQVRTGARR